MRPSAITYRALASQHARRAQDARVAMSDAEVEAMTSSDLDRQLVASIHVEIQRRLLDAHKCAAEDYRRMADALETKRPKLRPITGGRQ